MSSYLEFLADDEMCRFELGLGYVGGLLEVNFVLGDELVLEPVELEDVDLEQEVAVKGDVVVLEDGESEEGLAPHEDLVERLELDLGGEEKDGEPAWRGPGNWRRRSGWSGPWRC